MLIRAGLTFDGDHLARGIALRIREDRICDMGENLMPDAGESEISLPDAILSPGFIDVHIHGIHGHDTMHGEAHIAHMARRVVRHGVTGFLPTTMADSMQNTRLALKGAARLMENAVDGGARVLGCHLEGPYLNPVRRGAQPESYILPPSIENYRQLTEGFTHAVRMMTIAPEMPGATQLMDELRPHVTLAAGHTDATCEQIEAATAHGLTAVTHMFNGMNALNHRAPGVPGAALTIDGLSLHMIADLLHMHKNALKLCCLAKRTRHLVLITDAMEATDMPDGEYTLGANRVFVQGGAARLLEGNLAGSTLTMERAIQNMVQSVGVPLESALMMATANPARSIGEADRGRIGVGAVADLTLLSPSLDVLSTIVGGRVVHQCFT